MALEEIIVATTGATGALTTNVRYDGTIYAVPIPYDHAQVLSLVAENLATTETVDVYVWGGTKWVVVADATGTATPLTATKKADAFQAGLEYGVSKSVTATACSVKYAYAPRQF